MHATTTTTLALGAALAASAFAATGAAAADIPGNKSTQASIKVENVSIDGRWEMSGDRDWYRVKLTKGQAYIVTLSGMNSSLPAPWRYDAVLRSPGGSPLGSLKARSDKFDYPIIKVIAKETGTHFVDVGAVAEAPGQAGIGYAVGVGPDCADSKLTTCQLRPDVEQKRAAIGPTDTDWYRVSFQTGQRYTLVMTQEVLDLKLINSAGNVVASGKPGPDGESVIDRFKPGRSGDFFAVVGGAPEGSTYIGYNILLTTP